MKVAAKDPKSENAFVGEYDLGENIQDAISKFGEDVVFSYYKQKAVITIQSAIRGWIRAGKTSEEIQEKLNAYVLGVSHRTRKDPKEKLLDLFKGMTTEEKKEFLRTLKGI